MKNLALAIVLLFTFSVFGCQNNNESAEKTVKENDVQNTAVDQGNKKAFNFELNGINGKQVKLADYKGKVVIVDFWATWCPPCRRGIPDLIDIQKEFKDSVVVVGISVDRDTKKDVVPFAKKMGINYPVAYADMEVIQKFGGIQAIPTSFIIDQNGNIVESHVGLYPKETYVKTIKKLIEKS